MPPQPRTLAPLHPRTVPFLVLIAALTFGLGLGRQAITDSDEAFYAEASREMVETGDWLTPHFNYEDRWQKPVLYYWLTSAASVVTGPTEFAARLWSALSGVGLVLLTFVAARRGDAGWLAGAIVATCYGYFAMARLALPDLPLTFFITLGIWAGLERRWSLAGAAAGLGFLMKGPVALVVPALVLLPVWWLEGTLRVLRVRDVALAALVFAVLGLPWYGAMTLEHGAAYLESFFVGDNLERFTTGRFNAPRPFWFYLPILAGGLFPWSAFLFARPSRPDAEARRLTLWALLPLVFYTLSVGKQPRYILPVLPPLAILLARSILTRIEGAAAPGGRDKSLAVPTLVTALLFIVLAVLLVRARALFLSAHPSVTWMAVAAIVAAGGALASVAATRAWRRLPAVMTAAAVVLLLGVQFGALAGVRPEPVEQMAALVRAHRTAGQPVGSYQVFVRNLIFYTGWKQVELFDEARALDFLASPEPVLLVVGGDDLRRLEAISGVDARVLGEVRYLDTANVRLRTLLNPIPAQDVESVLLVTNR